MKFPRPLPQRLLLPPDNSSVALSFRAAKPEDLSPLYHACYSHYALPYFAASYQRILREQKAGHSVQLVAEVAGQGIVGSGQLVRYTDARAEIADLAVAASWRDQGMGTALIQVLTRIAREAGIRQLEIGVTEDNRRAQDLYRRLGFVPFREVELPGGGLAIFLGKELGPAGNNGERDEDS